MKVIRREWLGITRPQTWTLYPLGDVHLGNAACDEAAFRAVVRRIADDAGALWVGMGDYCDFINQQDKRFSPEALAPWIRMSHLGDLARAQRDRFLEIVGPIASKCLGLIEGNHERAIKDRFERDIYSDIVTGIKERAGFPPDHDLALGYAGWLVLTFYQTQTQHAGTRIRINLHHGFVAGKLAGAKALNMQRWLWTHDADLVIFGHSHNAGMQAEAVETVKGRRVVQVIRRGCYGGTFLGPARYAEERGYFPAPVVQPVIHLRPGAANHDDRIRIVA